MRKFFYLLITVGCIFFVGSAFAQTQVFMIAKDNNGFMINGGSIVAGHVNQIEVLSFSHGVSACPIQPCEASLSDYSFMMQLNSAYIPVRQMLLKGLHLLSVDVISRKAPATFDYYKIHMEDVAITSVQESGSSETPTVAISLAPGRIAWQSIAQKPDGSAGVVRKGGWDFNTNTEWIFF